MPAVRWLLALHLLFAAGAARADDEAWRDLLWLEPAGTTAPLPLLLTTPSGWQLGDAAVLLMPGGPGELPLRRRVQAALLAADAAVLELDPAAAQAAMPGLPPVPVLAPDALRPVLAEAARALRTEAGAGLVVAIGLGPAGGAALEAAEAAATPSAG
ncbi:hypothetical protein, partial [Paracraurococcus ruber]